MKKSDSAPEFAFQAMPRLSSTQHVQDQLISAIKNGHYQLGDKLPSERELCAQFQVSRVSVREAIAGLAAIGLVVIQRGKGAYVHSSPSDVYANQFEGYIKAHQHDLIELLGVRGALDGLAAKAAAQKYQSGSKAMEQLQHAEEQFATAANNGCDPETLANHDVSFHLAIATAAQNDLLHTLLKQLHGLLNQSRYMLFSQTNQPQKSASEHQEIYAAIKAGEPAKAHTLAIDHVAQMHDWVSNFKNDGQLNN